MQDTELTTSFQAPRFSRWLTKRSPNVGIDNSSMVINGSAPSLLSKTRGRNGATSSGICLNQRTCLRKASALMDLFVTRPRTAS
jgi:hypothetical protein